MILDDSLRAIWSGLCLSANIGVFNFDVLGHGLFVVLLCTILGYLEIPSIGIGV